MTTESSPECGSSDRADSDKKSTIVSIVFIVQVRADLRQYQLS